MLSARLDSVRHAEQCSKQPREAIEKKQVTSAICIDISDGDEVRACETSSALVLHLRRSWASAAQTLFKRNPCDGARGQLDANLDTTNGLCRCGLHDAMSTDSLSVRIVVQTVAVLTSATAGAIHAAPPENRELPTVLSIGLQSND
ncbi:MAG: hypothetical protein AB1586_33885 [Pseudomonadota bacterium]